MGRARPFCFLLNVREHSHMDAMKRDPSNNASAFLKIVRDSTERFKDVHVAMAEGYVF